MRARTFVVVLVGPTVILAAACSSFTSDVGAAEDAGVEARATEQPRATDAGATDAGKDAEVPCPDGGMLLGRFMTYGGKVNVHTPLSTAVQERKGDVLNGWFPDPDCTSGADVKDLGYCQVFWPTSTTVQGPVPPDPLPKPYFTEKCEVLVKTDPGQKMYLCCGAAE